MTICSARANRFFNALADRLTAEYQQGDAFVAGCILSQTLDLFYDDRYFVPPELAQSRLAELAGQILLDGRHGPGFLRTASEAAIQVGARDRLNDSRPEIRRRACVLLKEAGEELPPWFAGDPFVADLLEGQPQRDRE